MKHYYCSNFSKEYMYMGLLLYNSMLKWDKDFHFYMICLDDDAKRVLDKMNLQHATPIALSEIEKYDKELIQIKDTRTIKEYAWTMKPSIILYLLEQYKDIDHMVWIDGDTMFYSSPQPIFDEWDDRYSIMLTSERWRKEDEYLGHKYGKYNMGFWGVKKDGEGIKYLKWFRSKVLNWCYDKFEVGLWSDQVYINSWPSLFNRVRVIENLGVNVTAYIAIDCNISKKDHYLYANEEKLILFHNYGFKYYDGNEFDLCAYWMKYNDTVLRHIYLPYADAAKEIVNYINTVEPNFYQKKRPTGFVNNYFNLDNFKAGKDKYQVCTLFTKDYLVHGLTLYNSLKRYNDSFHLWICCVDDKVYETLDRMNLEHITLISLNNLKDKRVEKLQRQRETHELCWTLKSIFIEYITKNNFCLEKILYVDADIFFFDSLDAIYNEWGDNSVYISKQYLGPKGEDKYGKYNAGLIGFKRDWEGMKILKWWRDKCIEWCSNKFEKDRWTDQKYLDQWTFISSRIKVSQEFGVNVGPWNVGRVTQIDVVDNKVYINGKHKLVCYHFSGFKILGEKQFEVCSYKRKKRIPKIAEQIYDMYIKEVETAIYQILNKGQKIFCEHANTPMEKKHYPSNKKPQKYKAVR